MPKTNRNKAPTKIAGDALLRDVKQYPDDYMYERAQRFGCSKSGIESALKRLGIRQKNGLTLWALCTKRCCLPLSMFIKM